MTTTPGLGRLEVLSTEACERLLEQSQIGRLAVQSGGAPEVFPVNYAVDEGAVVFRTDDGLKLTLAERADVTFEVDGIDAEAREGWSVVIKGRAEEVTVYDRPALRERVSSLLLFPWAEGDKSHWVRIVPRQISGRRISHR
jgi:nitroimidazol reductase NimA-like FMN-containing flavoprotein (pyridoxamine 5'-phosphate oxidase superfamily)